MTNLQELIETANRLSKRLEEAANEEKRFTVDICLALEKMSWESLRLSNDLESIKSYI
jgi:hypothetical protein